MREQSIRDRYFKLLRGYVAKLDEALLLSAGDLGRELVLSDVPPEEVAEIHEEALRRLAREFPKMLLGEAAVSVSAPLMEMLMAYGLAFREQLEERKRAEKARELDRMKSDFLSNTSHELRTPLHSIRGFTRLMLSEKVTEPEAQKEFLHIIDEQSQRLGGLIDDLLDISRIESGRFSIQKQRLSVKEVIDSAVQELHGLTHESDVAIVKEIPESLPDVEADGQRLKQVIVNLLGNASKFSPDGGEIILRTEVKDRELLVQVTDHGIGIPEEAIRQLFDRFYQVDSSATRNTGGSGLGLYISKQIIEAHQGRIWAESVVGEGSTFSFTLPLPPVPQGRAN